MQSKQRFKQSRLLDFMYFEMFNKRKEMEDAYSQRRFNLAWSHSQLEGNTRWRRIHVVKKTIKMLCFTKMTLNKKRPIPIHSH